IERVKEFSDLKQEPPKFIELARPPASWPAQGAIKCEDLVMRYAAREKRHLSYTIYILFHTHFTARIADQSRGACWTGSGKSTLALSFFRFVELTEGRTLINDIDISKLGLTDLRSKLTIIPRQRPHDYERNVCSMLDVFNKYEDAEIYEALRREHLIPLADTLAEDSEMVNTNVFRNLESPVSEGGENFSTDEKQLLCMARAILKYSKAFLMDEVHNTQLTVDYSSVDYTTDELIGKTIRHKFAESTILTIAHRLHTVIDYDRIMLLEEGRIVEFDKPAALFADPDSMFYSLCKATGKN
ncbi:P-loop containing nucleoside triphosphate hydrolase protein, partial [Sparassis latifolia]